MARKITLTVPDALYKKINHWRSGFNLSRIFQDAVSEAIRKKEDFQKRIGEEAPLSDVISRLRKEKENWETRLSTQAEKAGMKWAARAHYEELILAVNTSADQLMLIPQIKQQIAETVDQLSGFPGLLNQHLDQLKVTVQRGWHRGVHEFWETVRDRI